MNDNSEENVVLPIQNAQPFITNPDYIKLEVKEELNDDNIKVEIKEEPNDDYIKQEVKEEPDDVWIKQEVKEEETTDDEFNSQDDSGDDFKIPKSEAEESAFDGSPGTSNQFDREAAKELRRAQRKATEIYRWKSNNQEISIPNINPNSLDLKILRNVGQRRRYQRLLNSGYTSKQALEKIAERIEKAAVKKEFKEKQKKALLDYRSKRLGVISTNPAIHMDYKQMETVEQAIRDEIWKNNDGTLIHFNRSIRQNGWMEVLCGNEETAKWLLSKSDTLAKSTGLSIKVIDDTSFTNQNLIRGFFYDCEKYSIETIRGILKTQARLPTEKWRLKNRIINGDAEELFFSVDDKSIRLLKKKKFNVALKFKMVKFNLVKCKIDSEPTDMVFPVEIAKTEKETPDKPRLRRAISPVKWE